MITMKTHAHGLRSFDFYFPDVDTQVLVEESEDEVVVRATRNTFSERRKIFFLRELAAEGFISENYQKFSGFASQAWLRVRWLIDNSWLKPNKGRWMQPEHLMLRVFAGAGAVWLGWMIWLFLR